MKNWKNEVLADEKAYKPQLVFEAGLKNHHIANTAYPIAHNKTWGPYRTGRDAHREVTANAFDHMDRINLYSHIPFCEKRCFFCEYTVVGQKELDRTRQYMNYLSKELQMYRQLIGEKVIAGFDIGGGTPSFIDAQLIDEHITEVNKYFNMEQGTEISIETTPKIASSEPDKIKAYFKSGIRRISMGIQVTQPDLLKVLGRESNGLDHMYKAAENIRQAGFQKFNIDLMYGFANQSLECWKATLKVALELNPDYITLYRMRYKLTRISHQAPLVNLKEVKEQAKLAKQMLTEAGFKVNPGKNTYSRIEGDTGTSTYLTRRVVQGMPYLGLGLGAQTFTDTSIAYNSGAVSKTMQPYFRNIDNGKLPIQDLYDLPKAHMMAKMAAVSFYFGEINLHSFKKKFAINFEDAYPEAVKYALSEGLMEYRESANGVELEDLEHYEVLALTDKGAHNFNGTIALFYAPSVQDYLLNRDPAQAKDMKLNKRLADKVAAV